MSLPTVMIGSKNEAEGVDRQEANESEGAIRVDINYISDKIKIEADVHIILSTVSSTITSQLSLISLPGSSLVRTLGI